MPKCPKCRQAMITILRREGGQIRTYYECVACAPPPGVEIRKE
jgi:hypothetical protein